MDALTKIAERIAHARARIMEFENVNTSKRERPRCGAKTRRGTRCDAPAVLDYATRAVRNGRCRQHGGLSTGPRTARGRERALANLRLGKNKKATPTKV